MQTSLTLEEPVAQADGKGFGIRAAAYVIDSIVNFVAGFVIQFMEGILIGIVYYASTGREIFLDERSAQALNFVGGIVIFLLYFVIFEWLFGATPGKLILGMRVVREDGTPCGIGAAILRALLRFFDGFLFGLPAYFIMKPPLQQRGGDQVAKTLVVGSQDPVIRERRAWWWFLIACVLYLALDAALSLYLILKMVD